MTDPLRGEVWLVDLNPVVGHEQAGRRPWEHDNLWGSATHQSKKHELLHRSFDAAMLTGIDVRSRRIAPM